MSDTEVGSIVAYLTLRREDWNAGVRATEEDSRRLGSLNPRIRIDANTGEILAQLGLVHAAERKVGTSASEAKPFVMNLWAALAAVAPAAVPIGAVAGGALLGLLPVVATVMLGFKGIANQMKSTALQGTQFATDVNALKGELSQLQTTAASGLMSGIDQALSSSQPLFGALNSEIGQTATQLGDIVGGAAPALLAILTELSPLITTIGGDLAAGAHELEHWAQSSNGISTFVAYVQGQLPEVEQLLGGVITLVGHLFEASAGPGAALLHDLNLVVAALDAIPVGVLQTAIPLAVSLYAALKTGQAVSAAVRGVDTAVGKLGTTLGLTGPKAEAAAAAQEASFAQTAAAAEAEAAVVADAAATEAEEMQAKQAEARAWGAAYDESVAQVAAAARAEATALAATAAEAQTAAEEKIAAAQAAADASVASGVESAAGWSAMLGPLAAVGIGVALFSTLLQGDAQAASAAAAAQDSYATSVKQSTNALSAVNIAQTNDNLAKSGALKMLDQLHQANSATSISYSDLTKAVNGSDAQFSALTAQLKGTGAVGAILTKDLTNYRQGLAGQITQQKDLNTLNAQATVVNRGQAAATAAQAASLHVTSAAYLAAQQAAQKNTDQTTAQTLAMQMENNAAGLLSQALQGLAGQNLSVAQAQTSLGQSLHSVIDSFAKNGDAIRGSSTAALSNQQAIEGNVSAARQLASAVAQQTGSNDKAIVSYNQSKVALEAQLRAHGELTPAVQRYVDKLYSVSAISDYLAKHPTKTDVSTGAAGKKIDQLEARINAIKQGVVPGVDANTDAGKRKIAELQAQIDALHGKTLSINTTVHRSDGLTSNPDKGRGFAGGGTVTGAGGPKSDSILARLSAGEEVTPEPQASKHRALLKAIAADQVPGFADGGTVGTPGVIPVDPTGKKKSGGSSKGGRSSSKRGSGKKGPTNSQLASVDSAESSLVAAAANMAATAASVRSAATSLDRAARAAGLSQAAIAAVAADQRRLSADAARRQSVAARLGTAPSAPTAYDRLAAAQGQYDSDKAKYSGALTGFDITGVTPPASQPVTSSRKVGGATITTTTPGGAALPLSAAAIVTAGGADVAKEQQFDALIHRLVAEGMDPDYVAQIAGKGPTPEALATAQALAKATPAQVRALNRQQGQRKAAGNDLGTFLAKQYDQAGVTAAKNLVAGLQSQEKTLTLEMERLADKMANAFSKRLGLPANRHVASSAGGPLHPTVPPVNVQVHPHSHPSARQMGRAAGEEIAWKLMSR